jgi:hypothetical protein
MGRCSRSLSYCTVLTVRLAKNMYPFWQIHRVTYKSMRYIPGKHCRAATFESSKGCRFTVISPETGQDLCA